METSSCSCSDEYLSLGRSWSEVIVGVDIFRPESESESLKIHLLRSPALNYPKVLQQQQNIEVNDKM